MANDRSMEDMLLEEHSRSLSFLPDFAAFFRFFWVGDSPHRFEPPYILGMLSMAIPSKDGPLARSSEYPSHYNIEKQPANISAQQHYTEITSRNVSKTSEGSLKNDAF